MATKDWIGRKVIIVGAARQGLALARYLAQQGAQVVLNDRLSMDRLAAVREELAGLPVEWVCGGHPSSLLDGADLLCPSGGVPLTLPLVVEAQARGIPLSNDSQIFMEEAPCKLIGITGSAGKTTTTTLVGRMAQQAVARSGAYRRAWVGGNIGTPLIAMMDEMQADDLAIMELSSFQLEIMTRSPQVAAVLNLTPNHLDRHGTMQAYASAKAHILDFQSPEDVAVLGRDGPGAWSLAEKVRGRLLSFGLTALPGEQPGIFYRDETIYLREEASQVEKRLLSNQDITLRGEHNLLNVMAACAVAAVAGLSDEAMRAGVRNFSGVPHRLEFVRSWGGADWYNDSIATAPERAMAAIRSFGEPLILLAGGRDKDLPWDAFADLVRRRVDHLVVFGEAADVILRAMTSVTASNGNDLLSAKRCNSLRDAVQVAAQIVEPGDVVLLSPGGTSFDEFNDFEERGECFAQWVNELP